jgi:parvulin-like peptidyl-prolyl isomerase
MQPFRIRWLKKLLVAAPIGCLTMLSGIAPAQEPVKPASASLPAKPVDATVAATVNGEVVRLDHVDALIRRRPLFNTPLSASQVKALRQDVLDALVDDTLFKQFLRQQGRKVEPAELEQHLAGLKEAVRRQGKQLSDYLREIGQSEAEIKDSITTMLQFNSYVEKRATDTELKAFFESNKDYFDNVQVKVSHIVIRVNPNAPSGEKTAAHEKLVKIRSEIAEGKITFADAARKQSVCASAAKGGELGFITRRDSLVDDSVAEVAFSLQVGHMGGPVTSDLGLHLVYVTDRTKGAPATYEKVIDWVRESYTEGLRQRIVEDLRKKSSITINLPN